MINSDMYLPCKLFNPRQPRAAIARFAKGLVLAVVGVVSLLCCDGFWCPSGFAATSQSAVPAAADLPQVEAGTQCIYSDGSWEMVKETGSGWIRLTNQDGETQVRSIDFTFQPFRYESATRQGTRNFTQAQYLLGKHTMSLWPLATGKITRFVEVGEYASGNTAKSRYEAYWQCEVRGTKKVTVAAGTFDAWDIGCNKYRDSFQGDSQESWSWLYVPSIHHWVSERVEGDDHSTGKNRELVAFLPDIKRLSLNAKQLGQLQKQFQEVLEQNGNGEEDILLSASETGLTSAVVAKDSFNRPDGMLCRHFTQRVQNGQTVQNSLGLACRGAEGIWKIPRN